MDPIRVLVTRMPSMLRDVVRASLAQHPDVELLPAEPECTSLVRSVEESRADVVIVGIETSDELHAYDDVLYQIPDTCIAGVTRDGHDAALACLTPSHELLTDVSAADLLSAVRSAGSASRARVMARRPS